MIHFQTEPGLHNEDKVPVTEKCLFAKTSFKP